MRKSKYNFFVKIFFTFAIFALAGIINSYGQDSKDRKWHASFDLGVQMSGIKSEDFVNSNYSPVYRILILRELSPNFAIQIGYQGRYFRAISDDLKYHYNFFFIEGMGNITNLFLGRKNYKKYNLWFHTGPGYFYHKIYDRSNMHWNIGVSNTFFLSDSFDFKFDISAIIGWDIYQANNDILPNISIGFIYKNLFDR